MSKLEIALNEQAQLIGVVLAASDWPQQEQAQLTHAVHPLAKRTRQWVQPFAQHVAVQQLNRLLAAGIALDVVYASGFAGEWATQLETFAKETAVATAFWPQHESVWETAVSDLQAIINIDKLEDFLGRLLRETAVPALQMSPNLLYPALTTVLAKTEGQWYLLLPPPKAVGESPPWPYAEDPGWVVAQLCQGLLPSLIELPDEQPTWLHALTAVCLGELVDSFEAQAYVLRSRKQYKLPDLPAAVTQVEDYLSGKRAQLL